MDDFAPLLGLLLLAVMVFFYLPVVAGVLIYDRATLRGARHHDHLIPATPRSARR